MLRRIISLAVVSVLGLVNSPHQAHASGGGGVPNFEFHSDPVAGFEASTVAPFSISGGELTLSSGTVNSASSFWTPGATFTAEIFGPDLPGGPAPGASNAAYGAEWDFLWNSTASITIAAVPEPATGGLVLVGSVLLFGTSRWRKKMNRL